MRKDKVLLASSSALAVVLVVALVGMINWLGHRHYLRGDWTSDKQYSLSDKTKNVLEGLQSEVRVVAFMTPATPLFRETRELLTRYEAASANLKVEFIDPDRDPLRTRALAQEFGVSAANTVVFSSGERSKYVTSDQLADYDYSGMQMGQAPRLKGYKGEEQFTAAILGVADAAVPRICFTTGHGEADPDAFGEDGLSSLREAIKRDNLEVEKVSLLGGDVPEPCSLLVVAGPTVPFAEPEKAAFRSYVEAGGRALLLLDPPLAGRTRPSGLEEVVAAWGVQVNEDLVIDPARRLPFFDLSAVYVTDFRSHPAVSGLQGLAVLLPITRSVTTTPVAGVTGSILLTTSNEGWGERDLQALLASGQAAKGEGDTPGPVPLAVAAEPAREQENADGASRWRLIVIGNSAFAMNAHVSNAGNLNLALNAVNWLIEREQSLGIAASQPEQVQLFLSASQLRNVALISLLGLPAAAIALGVVVWLRRRR